MTNDFLATNFLNVSSKRMNEVIFETFFYIYTCVMYFGLIYFSDSISPTVAGLSITALIMIKTTFSWCLQELRATQTQMVCVNRVIEYTKLKPEESSAAVPIKVEGDWPSSGSVVFENVSLAYEKDENGQNRMVLRGINAQIASGEKIGICGRTGAGKSSLITCLFRLVDFDGSIRVDQVDTKQLKLATVRRAISIIPQDPILFSGTIRTNLDPFNEFSNADIWRCLVDANLDRSLFTTNEGSSQKSIEELLNSEVTDKGSNLSAGQRQLMCLARALLRNNKILVLDEATANVDHETDQLIQATIRTKFSTCTVLTIAHRINTIIDFDRIMVVDAGQIVEFDKPKVLLESKGHFYQMANKAGLVN